MPAMRLASFAICGELNIANRLIDRLTLAFGASGSDRMPVAIRRVHDGFFLVSHHPLKLQDAR
jgi:hypothetical protein